MDDRMLMESLLVSTKNACELFMHGTIEASTSNVKSTFDQALQDVLQIQNDIYSRMAEKGWYPQTTVEQQKIQQVAQKFQANA